MHAQGQTRVAIAVQVVSSHPLLTRAVEKILARAKDFRIDVLPPALNEAEAISQSNSPRLFLLDGCSLRTDLGRLAERCRATSPGSKFLALLSPENGSHAEKTRLFYWGIDGFVELHKTWQTELPLAIRAVLGGQPWVPPEILVAFVKQAKMLLDVQLFLSLWGPWKYSKRKAEGPQAIASFARRGISEFVQYKINSTWSKKTVAFTGISVIFLALLWFRDYRRSMGSSQLYRARGVCAGRNASGYRRPSSEFAPTSNARSGENPCARKRFSH